MTMQLRNLERKPAGELAAIRRRADGLKAEMTAHTWG